MDLIFDKCKQNYTNKNKFTRRWNTYQTQKNLQRYEHIYKGEIIFTNVKHFYETNLKIYQKGWVYKVLVWPLVSIKHFYECERLSMVWDNEQCFVRFVRVILASELTVH